MFECSNVLSSYFLLLVDIRVTEKVITGHRNGVQADKSKDK
jgi:hypothetical protein